MKHHNLQNGDIVYAAITIANDGSVPDAAENEVFADAGTAGMLLNTGHFEHDPSQELYLVSFRNAEGELGPPVTCLAHELRDTPLTLQ
jgi:nitrogen fixation protein NifZ